MKRYLSIFGIISIVSGCATGPTKEELANADFGKNLNEKECQVIAQDFISKKLKDPDSAKFAFANKCEKGFTSSVPILGLPIAYGWMQKGEVNAKNSFGGYTGFSKFMVLMKDGKPVRYCMETSSQNCFIEEA